MSFLSHDLVISKWPTGSRYICNPAPTDTDNDTVILVAEGKLKEAALVLLDDGWKPCGADYGNYEEWFSMRKGEENYIVYDSVERYRGWVNATELAKKLNLLKKEERILLFKVVAHGETLF